MSDIRFVCTCWTTKVIKFLHGRQVVWDRAGRGFMCLGLDLIGKYKIKLMIVQYMTRVKCPSGTPHLGRVVQSPVKLTQG